MRVDRIEDAPDETSAPLPTATLAQAAGFSTRRAQRRQTDRDIWALGWPVILSGGMASTVGLVDLAMLRSLGTTDLVAVGWATQFYMLAQSILMSGGVACVAMMSRAIGAGVPDRARAALAANVSLSVTAAVGLFALAAMSFESALRGFGVSSAVVNKAVPYFQLTMASSVLFAVAFTYESGFRAAKNTFTPMILTAGIAVTKLGLNYVFIYGALGFSALGLAGAGLATLVSQAFGVMLFSVVSRSGECAPVLRLGRADFRAGFALLSDSLRLAAPAASERLFMSLGLMSYFAILTAYDEIVIAAYTIGVRMLSFSWIPGMGFSTAASTLVGQALGASNPEQAARAGWRAARICVLVSLALGSMYALFRNELSSVFTQDPAVIAALQPLILMLCLAQPFMALHFSLGGGLRGAGDTVTPLAATLAGTWLFRVSIAFVFARVLNLELVWVWGALVLDHLARSIWLARAFHLGRWRENLGLGRRTTPQVA